MLLLAVLRASLAGAQESSHPAPLPEGALFGKIVVSVAYTADGPVDQTEVPKLIEVKEGRPLTEDATSATIRNLYATLQFSDIRIEAQDSPGGVAVTVELFRSYRVMPLKFSSPHVSRAELRRVLGFQEGSVYQAEAVEQGVGAIKRRLAEEGYLEPKVTPDVFLDPATFDARVLYRIEAGKPARAAAPFFDGKIEPYTASMLEKKMHLKPGDRYRESKAKADATRLTDLFHKQSRFKGTVELIAAQPTDDGRVMPVYRVSVGPEVLFETVGIKAKTVRSQMRSLLAEQVFDEDLVLQYVEEKRAELQNKGYYRAKVDYSMTQKTPEALVVTITVNEGVKYRVEKIAFSGNLSVKDKALLAVMVTRKKGLPLLQPGHLVDEDLTGDVASILGYYQTRGWIGAKVDKPQVTDGSKPDRLVVTIPIQEGPRTSVGEVRVEGGPHAGDAITEKKLLIKSGAFYNPNLVRQDVVNLQTWYHDHGWREASVKDDVRLSADGSRADVGYLVDEGVRTFFGKTIVRGNVRTRIKRITRQAAWKEGQPFSEADILQTQRNLSRTGVFRRVDLRPQPADPKTQVRNVEVDLQEGRPWSLLYGVGYQYAPDASENRSDPFAIAGVTYNNVFGRMQSIGFEAQYAPISSRGRFQVSFREPYFFNTKFPLTILAYYRVEPIQDIDIRRNGTIVETSRYYGKFLRVALRYAYERIEPVNPQDLSNIEKENFPASDRPILQSTIGPNFLYDRRDDIIDPHTGYYVTGQYKYAFPFLSAEARYHKISGQGAHFWRVGKSVFALALRAGAIWPYGPPDIQVPIAERNFAGGRSTNRAWDTDLLGVPGVVDPQTSIVDSSKATVDYNAQATPHTGTGTGSCASAFPGLTAYDCDYGPRIVGGNGFLGINAEVRVPIFGGFGATVFYDAAQVWADVSRIRLTLNGADGLRQGVGVGLHYLTPIGPIRLEYGWPVAARTITYNATVTETVPDPKDPTKTISVTTPLDCSGHKTSVAACTATTRETGKLFVSIGYPF